MMNLMKKKNKLFNWIVLGSFFLIFFIIFINLFFSQNYLLLSFDTEITDNNQTIHNLLDLLSKYDAKSTFFVTIDFAKQNPELIYEINNQGHEIACHTINHPNLNKLNYSLKYEEISGCKSYLKDNFNISVIGFRAPYRRIFFQSFLILKHTNYSYDASVFEGLKYFYFNFIIKEIYTSSYGFLPIDDYVLLKSLNFNSKTYFYLLNNYKLPYKSFSFHPHLIMQYQDEFETFIKYQSGNIITHKEYLEISR